MANIFILTRSRILLKKKFGLAINFLCILLFFFISYVFLCFSTFCFLLFFGRKLFLIIFQPERHQNKILSSFSENNAIYVNLLQNHNLHWICT